MADYQPTSRRPIAEIFRLTAGSATRFCVRAGIQPDTISYFSIAAAAAAAVCFCRSLGHPALLLVAPLFCFLRLWCNMLDGMVALAAGSASGRGEILNDLPDRVSDVVIFIGAAHSGWMQPLLGYWAAIMSLGTAYVGTLGQAVGVRREFGGIMSKPWRMVTLSLGAWVTFGCFVWQHSSVILVRLSLLDWTCVLIVAGCVETCAVRLRDILRALQVKNGAR
ncbi:MAG: CDP-alcohol phosphatidyltransferase family protein [Chthoniobacterales bacterium]|nr:CDP-alcohol phosphatidyltransferase family protein [Chthoniobacterales bacterium]